MCSSISENVSGGIYSIASKYLHLFSVEQIYGTDMLQTKSFCARTSWFLEIGVAGLRTKCHVLFLVQIREKVSDDFDPIPDAFYCMQSDLFDLIRAFRSTANKQLAQ